VVTFTATGVGALLLVLLGVVLASASHETAPTAPAPSASASTGATIAQPPPPPPDPKTDDIVNAAQGKIDKGDYATAIDELTAVEKTAPGRADVHMLLERAYTGVRNTPSAMHEAELWLQTDPNAVADMKLQEDIRNAALLRDAQDHAFQILETKMGMRGIDIVFDIAYGSSGRLYPQAAGVAKRALETPDIKRRESPALSILIAFRDAKTCEQKHGLLETVRDRGDARILPVLQPYESGRGCGFLGTKDCYPCMHRDHLLEEAKQAINERARQQGQ
jgi:serine/threonine-protein kinase